MATYILGINSAYHESAACLIKDGKIIAAVEEERFNRMKHAKAAKVDNPDELPLEAINYCLKEAGLELKDVDHIGFSFSPEKRLKNIGVDKYFKKGGWGSREGERLFYKKLKTIPKKLSNLAGVDITKKFHWIEHHLCHAAGSFFISPFRESIILVMDGIGEFATTWIGYGKENKIYKLKEIPYPNSIGFLWEKMSEFLGFTEYDAGKVMGLSSHGDWKNFYDKMRKIIDFNDKDIFTINNDIVKFRTKDFSQLEKLFGIKRRKKGEKIEKVHMHLAAVLQKTSEQAILRCIDFAEKKFASKYLCLSGGVMLNCPANESAFQLFPLKDIFIPSGSQDAGTAIGAAFYIWNQLLGKKRKFVYNHAYWGPEYSNEEIKKVLENYNLPFKKVKNIEKQTARLVSRGNIVAWFQGRLEVGPRALGNRSILADPRRKEMVDLINQKVKKREWFRPFAPSVLAEKAKSFFYLRNILLADRFMLFAVLPKYPEKIPSVVHIDGTCRIQVVRKEDNPKYHKMLKEFEAITKIPLVLNTSLNVQEPIVCSPKEAINTFMKTDIDYLAIGDYLVKK